MVKSIYISYLNPNAKPNEGFVVKYSNENDGTFLFIPIRKIGEVVQDTDGQVIKHIKTVDQVISNIAMSVSALDYNYGKGEMFIKVGDGENRILTKGMKQLQKALNYVWS